MKIATITAVAFAAVLANVAAAQRNPHLSHVAERWRDTPDNVGLLQAARMEAEFAARHAELAASDLENLGSIKRHTAHVLHALDPEVQASGPGAGYGLVKAVRGVATHIKLAAETDGASDNIKRHANHVATSAENVEQWSLAVIDRGQRIMETDDVSEAATLAREIHEMTQNILEGRDANGDGRTSWQEGEGGLAQCEQHMNLLLQGEHSMQ